MLSIKERNPRFDTLTDSLFKEHCYHFIPFATEPLFELVLHILPYS